MVCRRHERKLARIDPNKQRKLLHADAYEPVPKAVGFALGLLLLLHNAWAEACSRGSWAIFFDPGLAVIDQRGEKRLNDVVHFARTEPSLSQAMRRILLSTTHAS